MTRRTTLSDDAIALREMKLAYRAADKEAKRLKAEHDKAEQRFIERMESEGAEGHKAGGVTFSPAEQVYSSVNDRTAFVEWALENEPELVHYTERKDLMNQLIRERIDNGEEPPPGTTFYIKQYVSQTAS